MIIIIIAKIKYNYILGTRLRVVGDYMATNFNLKYRKFCIECRDYNNFLVLMCTYTLVFF